MQAALVLTAVLALSLAGCTAPKAEEVVDGVPVECLQPAPESWQAYTGPELAAVTDGDWKTLDSNLSARAFEALAFVLRPWNGTPYDVSEFTLSKNGSNLSFNAVGGRLVDPEAGRRSMFLGTVHGDSQRIELLVNADGSVEAQTNPTGYTFFGALPIDSIDFARRVADPVAAQLGYPAASSGGVKWDPQATLCLRSEYPCGGSTAVPCRGGGLRLLEVWVGLDGEVKASIPVLQLDDP